MEPGSWLAVIGVALGIVAEIIRRRYKTKDEEKVDAKENLERDRAWRNADDPHRMHNPRPKG
jgi:hypothetical protein